MDEKFPQTVTQTRPQSLHLVRSLLYITCRFFHPDSCPQVWPLSVRPLGLWSVDDGCGATSTGLFWGVGGGSLTPKTIKDTCSWVFFWPKPHPSGGAAQSATPMRMGKHSRLEDDAVAAARDRAPTDRGQVPTGQRVAATWVAGRSRAQSSSVWVFLQTPQGPKDPKDAGCHCSRLPNSAFFQGLSCLDSNNNSNY